VWCISVSNTSDTGWLCRCLRMRRGFWWRCIWVRSRAGPKSIQPDVSAMSHCLPAIIRTDLLSLHRLLGNKQYYIPLVIDRSDQSINQSICQSVTVQIKKILKYNHNSEMHDNGLTEKPGPMKAGHPLWTCHCLLILNLKCIRSLKTTQDPSVFCLFSIDDCKVNEVLGPNYKRP